MTFYDSSMAPRFAQLLDQRARALQDLLRRDLEATDAQETHDVADMKDAAGDQAQAVVSGAQSASAAIELGEVVAARRRLRDGTYGCCADCGQPVKLARLLALPATPYCLPCQSARESAHAAH